MRRVVLYLVVALIVGGSLACGFLSSNGEGEPPPAGPQATTPAAPTTAPGSAAVPGGPAAPSHP